MDYFVDYDFDMGYPYISRGKSGIDPLFLNQNRASIEASRMSNSIMQSNQNSKDSDLIFAKTEINKMKISLFYKSYIIKTFLCFMFILFIASTPSKASAGFFSDIASIFGAEAAADETTIEESAIINNSQNIPLLESSVNPDIKNTDQDTAILQDDSFIYSDGLGIPDAKFEKSSISDSIRVYTVEKGDTLSTIAEMFDVSVNTIRWENNLSGQSISIGQKLNILPVTGIKHTVKSGDTVSKIAAKYDAEGEDVLIFNGISKGDGLKQGDIIFVPNGVIVPVVKSPSVKAPTTSKNTYSNTKAPSGYYIKPAAGIITSPYGPRRGGFHYGVDIGNARGTTVVAAASGVVVNTLSYCVEGKSSCGGRYGNYITIQHSNGTRTRYAHLAKVSVSVGESVSQGEKIGTLGNTGGSTGPHLHFEVENSNGSKMRPSI